MVPENLLFLFICAAVFSILEKSTTKYGVMAFHFTLPKFCRNVLCHITVYTSACAIVHGNRLESLFAKSFSSSSLIHLILLLLLMFEPFGILRNYTCFMRHCLSRFNIITEFWRQTTPFGKKKLQILLQFLVHGVRVCHFSTYGKVCVPFQLPPPRWPWLLPSIIWNDMEIQKEIYWNFN